MKKQKEINQIQTEYSPPNERQIEVLNAATKNEVDTQNEQEIKDFVRVASVVRTFRNMRILQISSRPKMLHCQNGQINTDIFLLKALRKSDRGARNEHRI